jgi:hypothetical protein
MDTTVSQREQSVTKSYHDASAIYGAHFLKFMGVTVIPAAVAYVLSMALKVSIIASLTHATGLSDIFLPEHISSAVTTLLIVTIIFIQTFGVIALIYTVTQHEKVTVLDAFEHALGYFWRFVVVAVATVLVGFLGLVVGFIPVAIIGVIVGVISIDALNVTYDWLTLIAPVVSAIFSTYVVFAPYVLIDKNTSIRTALRTSHQLVRGHFWSTAVRLLIFYSAIAVAIIVLQFIPLAGSLISLLTITPFTVVYLYTLYKHLEALRA